MGKAPKVYKKTPTTSKRWTSIETPVKAYPLAISETDELHANKVDHPTPQPDPKEINRQYLDLLKGVEVILLKYNAWEQPVSAEQVTLCFDTFDALAPDNRNRRSILSRPTASTAYKQSVAEHWSDSYKDSNVWNALIDRLSAPDTHQSTIDTLIDIWSCLDKDKCWQAISDLFKIGVTNGPDYERSIKMRHSPEFWSMINTLLDNQKVSDKIREALVYYIEPLLAEHEDVVPADIQVKLKVFQVYFLLNDLMKPDPNVRKPGFNDPVRRKRLDALFTPQSMPNLSEFNTLFLESFNDADSTSYWSNPWNWVRTRDGNVHKKIIALLSRQDVKDQVDFVKKCPGILPFCVINNPEYCQTLLALVSDLPELGHLLETTCIVEHGFGHILTYWQHDKLTPYIFELIENKLLTKDTKSVENLFTKADIAWYGGNQKVINIIKKLPLESQVNVLTGSKSDLYKDGYMRTDYYSKPNVFVVLNSTLQLPIESQHAVYSWFRQKAASNPSHYHSGNTLREQPSSRLEFYLLELASKVVELDKDKQSALHNPSKFRRLVATHQAALDFYHACDSLSREQNNHSVEWTAVIQHAKHALPADMHKLIKDIDESQKARAAERNNQLAFGEYLAWVKGKESELEGDSNELQNLHKLTQSWVKPGLGIQEQLRGLKAIVGDSGANALLYTYLNFQDDLAPLFALIATLDEASQSAILGASPDYKKELTRLFQKAKQEIIETKISSLIQPSAPPLDASESFVPLDEPGLPTVPLLDQMTSALKDNPHAVPALLARIMALDTSAQADFFYDLKLKVKALNLSSKLIAMLKNNPVAKRDYHMIELAAKVVQFNHDTDKAAHEKAKWLHDKLTALLSLEKEYINKPVVLREICSRWVESIDDAKSYFTPQQGMRGILKHLANVAISVMNFISRKPETVNEFKMILADLRNSIPEKNKPTALSKKTPEVRKAAVKITEVMVPGALLKQINQNATDSSLITDNQLNPICLMYFDEIKKENALIAAIKRQSNAAIARIVYVMNSETLTDANRATILKACSAQRISLLNSNICTYFRSNGEIMKELLELEHTRIMLEAEKFKSSRMYKTLQILSKALNDSDRKAAIMIAQATLKEQTSLSTFFGLSSTAPLRREVDLYLHEMLRYEENPLKQSLPEPTQRAGTTSPK